ncbi:MAG: hypothetical protein F4Z01_01640 [Gammaproteobacteria bacterium]|nr:hypothetical protein [Gammaproteobacteria bacterium]MYF37216.1 hypothetical protein [Gammaproteobacteria bacterium]
MAVPTDTPSDQGSDGTTDSSNETQPYLASTMILVRDQPSGYEVFMIERPKKGAFPRLHVFPGGKIDPIDSEMEQYCPFLCDARASKILNVEEKGLRFWVGAIRECFEECGVLFALQNGQLLEVRTEQDRQELRGWATKVATSAEFFKLLLEERTLKLATDHIHYFSHWITPKPAPTRFNTRFFLAKLPSGQSADALTTEVVSACWIQPSVALKKFKTKEWQMILPTLTTLRMISNYTDADDLIEHVRAGYHKIPVRPGKQLQGMQPFEDQ